MIRAQARQSVSLARLMGEGPWAEYRAAYIKARLELEKKHPPSDHLFYVRDRALRIKHGIEMERKSK